MAVLTVTVSSALYASAIDPNLQGKSGTLEVGDTIPDVSVAGIKGGSVSLRAIVSKKPTVLIFYRGGWCPYCNTHLGKLQSIESEILGHGYQIVALSPDRPAELERSLEKHKLTYALFSDSAMDAAKAFGLAFTVENTTLVKYRIVGINLEKASGEEHHMLPVPAVFLVNTDGMIQFAYSNHDYKVRLETDKILGEITRASGK